jgi:hypothetical protein
MIFSRLWGNSSHMCYSIIRVQMYSTGSTNNMVITIQKFGTRGDGGGLPDHYAMPHRTLMMLTTTEHIACKKNSLNNILLEAFSLTDHCSLSLKQIAISILLLLLLLLFSSFLPSIFPSFVMLYVCTLFNWIIYHHHQCHIAIIILSFFRSEQQKHATVFLSQNRTRRTEGKRETDMDKNMKFGRGVRE